jgi:hypothetical protein
MVRAKFSHGMDPVTAGDYRLWIEVPPVTPPVTTRADSTVTDLHGTTTAHADPDGTATTTIAP